MPLTLQIAFSSQSGDPVFRPPEAGGFVRPCGAGPTPRIGILPCAFRVRTGTFWRGWLAERRVNVLDPVAIMTDRSLGSRSWPKPWAHKRVTRIAAGLYFVPRSRDAALRHTPQSLCERARPRPGGWVTSAPNKPPKPLARGAKLPAVPGLSAVLPALSRGYFGSQRLSASRFTLVDRKSTRLNSIH